MSDHRPKEVTAAEPFADLDQQNRAVHLGMWVFLGSETLLFGGLFGVFAGYRIRFSAEFHEAARHNDRVLGTTNTVILIVSSFFVAWAIHALRRGRRRAAIASLVAVLALGAAFLTIKGFEYSHHFQEGIAPGIHYASTEVTGTGAQMFFTLYYLMTGLHALHVIGGMLALGILTLLVQRQRVRAEHPTALEMGGLYWHLVDIVWIFLWPLFYLVG